MLRGAAVGEWESFLVAMEEYSLAQGLKMVDCTPDMLPRAQGMAIAMRELVEILVTAPRASREKRNG